EAGRDVRLLGGGRRGRGAGGAGPGGPPGPGEEGQGDEAARARPAERGPGAERGLRVDVAEGEQPQAGAHEGGDERRGRGEDLVVGPAPGAQAEDDPGGGVARAEGEGGGEDGHVPASGDVALPHVALALDL